MTSPIANMVSAALPASALLFCAPAEAQIEQRSETLEYQLSDLAHPDQLDTLQRQIRRAARRVCTFRGVRGLNEWSAQRRCTHIAYSAAIDQLDQRLASLNPTTVADTAPQRLVIVAPVD